MKHYSMIKRMIDFILALIMFIVLMPVMIIVAILIKATSKGPILFKQQRPGKNIKIFTVYKFRTMITTTQKNGELLTDMERMTSIGNILRKTSLDELPQLFNIIKGDMSFIGPRPLLVRYIPYYTKQQMRRHEVTPGISGWAQVNGRNTINWSERFKLDVWYVDHISFNLDIKIFFMTIKKVFLRDGINTSKSNTMTFFDEEVKRSKKDEKL